MGLFCRRENYKMSTDIKRYFIESDKWQNISLSEIESDLINGQIMELNPEFPNKRRFERQLIQTELFTTLIIELEEETNKIHLTYSIKTDGHGSIIKFFNELFGYYEQESIWQKEKEYMHKIEGVYKWSYNFSNGLLSFGFSSM